MPILTAPDSGDAGMACAMPFLVPAAKTKAAPPAWMRTRRLGLPCLIDSPCGYFASLIDHAIAATVFPQQKQRAARKGPSSAHCGKRGVAPLGPPLTFQVL